MDVLGEILKWSESRPDWQRDALRRLAATGEELEGDDITELAEICKSKHGLADAQELKPLTKDNLPVAGDEAEHVNIQSIYHHKGVNALAEDQTVNFGSGLTVVYGDNAAGKSGYTRIFKGACGARGREKILGNVVSGSPPPAMSVEIKYTIGDDGEVHVWSGKGSDESISRVSVFDSHSATVYLTEKTDVAFRPFGLDLFDKLVKACRAVKQQLETEHRVLNAGVMKPFDLPEGTAAAKLVANLSSLTDPKSVTDLSTLSGEENERRKLLQKSLVDLRAKDPAKAAKELTLRAGRLRTLVEHLKSVDGVLAPDNLNTVFDEQVDVQKKRDAAKKLREDSFPEGLLEGTGREAWAELWEAARRFSESSAYPGQEFPVTDDASACLLCQQSLENGSPDRLRQFETFVASVAEKDFREARGKYALRFKAFDELAIKNDTVNKVIEDVRIEQAELADELEVAVGNAEGLRSAVLEGLKAKEGKPDDLPEYASVVGKIDELARQLDERVKTLQKEGGAEEKQKLEAELKELDARTILGKFEDQVLAEIDRKKKIAAYGLCLNDTNTQGITSKSTKVTKVVVTEKLKTSFQEELKKLKFKHVEVELTESGGDAGNLYHRLVLKRAPGVELPRVVSEGEQRCLSIAAFFAELSTADDPVSSLDYKWREGVAQRLVEEAKTRQVMVFTHDVVFLLQLRQYAKLQNVGMLDQHIMQIPTKGAGICEQELPWIAMPVKKRIGVLKSKWQDADKLFRDGHQAAYEQEAAYIYGRLRESWERGLEEVLLGGVVERFRVGVQTQQIGLISDITPEDCDAIETGMTKCSKWLTGHDQGAGAPQDIPEPDELKQDIEALEVWVKQIRDRR